MKVPSLRVLKLEKNSLKDGQMEILFGALPPTLRELSLADNDLGSSETLDLLLTAYSLVRLRMHDAGLDDGERLKVESLALFTKRG